MDKLTEWNLNNETFYENVSAGRKDAILRGKESADDISEGLPLPKSMKESMKIRQTKANIKSISPAMLQE